MYEQNQIFDPKEVLRIGARALSKEQAKVILPTYNKLHEQVKNFREQAWQYQIHKINEKNKLLHPKEINSDFNNVISILGKRGTGKSSVMMTFKYYHTIDFKKLDIILPVIDPDQMSNASHALGWIISFLQKEMQNVNFLYKKKIDIEGNWNQERFCDKEGKSVLDKAYFELQKAYLLRQESYVDIIRKRDEGIIEHIKDNEKIINYDRQLIDLLHDFIDKLIETKKKTNEDNNSEPLILVFFDDVDISAGRCAEVLDTIRIFLSHPNIVTFVSGDYDVFLEAITIYMLHEEKVPSNHYETKFVNEDALSYRRSRSREYLKKVFSPAFRFEMKSELSQTEKQNFKYYISKDVDKEAISLKELLHAIDFDNNGNKLKEIPEIYYNIFDGSPRGLINPYYFLYQNKSNIWEKEDIFQFFDIIINSNTNLEKFKKEIRKLINIKIKNENLYDLGDTVNYSTFSLSFTQKNIQKDFSKKYENLQIQINIFLLADFFEKIMKIYNPNYKVNNKSKTRYLIGLLNNTSYLEEELLESKMRMYLFPNISDIKLLLKFFQALSPILEELNRPLFDFEFNSKNDDYFFERKYLELISDNNQQELYLIFKEIYSLDQTWVKNLVNYISKASRSENEIIKEINDEILYFTTFWDDNPIQELSLKPKHFNKNNLEEKIQNFDKKSIDNINFDSIQYFVNIGVKLINSFKRKQEFHSDLKKIDVDIKHFQEQRLSTEEQITRLNYTRWLNSSEKIKEVRKRIKSIESYVKKINQQEEIQILINNYFTEELLSIDREDIDNFYEKNVDIYEPFLEALDEELIFKTFYPIEILAEYLDKYLIKQIIKNENFKFIGLLYKDEEDSDDISEIMSKEIENYFKATKELEVLKILLPKGETISNQDLKNYNTSLVSIMYELKALEIRRKNLQYSLNKIDDSIKNDAYLIFDEEVLSQLDKIGQISSDNELFRYRIIDRLVELYVNYENKIFKSYYDSIFLKIRDLEQKSILENVYLITKEIISSRKVIVSSSQGDRKIWQEIINKAEFDPFKDTELIPSLELHADLKFTLEKLKVEEEEVNGDIVFFIKTKEFLSKISKENYSAFDLYLKRLLDNKWV